MNFYNKLAKQALSVLTAGVVLASCQKMEQPALTDYPLDTNAPGGPLKLYAAFDGRSVDSIRAVFGVDHNVSYVDGVSAQAMSAGTDGFVVFPSTNDFKTATSFTVAFWMKKAGPNPKGNGTSFAFGVATQTDIWTKQDLFLEFEDAGNPSSADSAAAKFYINDQWFEFTRTDAIDKRLPHVLDGQWHHLAFTLDASNATFTTYIDGQPFTNLPADFGKFTKNDGKANFSKVSGVVVGGPGHFAIGKTPDAWMGNFNGQIDQFRMYGTALSAADVSALFSNKQ